jgi:hypothetical protein
MGRAASAAVSKDEGGPGLDLGMGPPAWFEMPRFARLLTMRAESNHSAANGRDAAST